MRQENKGAAVYVGTYGKYNNGSIKGGWLYLTDYATYNDFLAACKKLHADERDPEYMIQDSENFPDGLDCMEWLSAEDFQCVKQAMREEEQEAEGKPSVNIIEYSGKAFAVVGDTKAVRDALKRMGGRFNAKLTCGAGWIFPNKSREAVEKFITSGEATEAVRQERNAITPEGAQFTQWLQEYIATGHDDYFTKHAVGAIKLHDAYYLIKKPSIENRFCFHDEGPDYDLYKGLTSHDDKMAAYFKAENLKNFDRYIERIEFGDKYNFDKRVWWSINGYDKNRLELRFYTHTYDRDEEGETLCTDEEKQLILKGLKFGRAMLEKRLDAYLKRYGVSKLHTWTYWADA